MKSRTSAVFALFAFLALAPGTLAAEKPKETWVNYYDAAKGLWAKKELVSGDVLYLTRYGESREQVSFLKEEEIEGLAARTSFDRILKTEREAHSRGIGDSLFRPASTVGEVARIIENSGWSVKSYETAERIYEKKGVKASVKLPRELSREIRGSEALTFLVSAGIELPKEPVPSKPVPKNRNK